MGTNQHTAGTRSGSLNGVLWGVSRWSNMNNTGQGMYDLWADSTQNQCGNNVQVAPDSDVNVCKGNTVESVNDSGNQTVLAMYPRQPFNFTGRTGTVEFDVSDNSGDPHGAWPTFAITDQPVPAPYGDNLPGAPTNARNSVGINFVGNCNPSTQWCGANRPSGSFSTCEVPKVWATQNYQTVGVTTNIDGCVLPSTSPGSNNHVEIQISGSRLDIYMSDPGNPSSLRLVGDAELSMPLTQGLVWMEDVHYNGNKYCPQVTCQQSDTFTWANLAFDGPVLPRDLGFDAPDSGVYWNAIGQYGTAQNGQPTRDLCYYIPANGTQSFNWSNVSGVGNASGALLVLNYTAAGGETITYNVNGSNNTYNNGSTVDSGTGNAAQTLALPIPVSQLRNGANTITLSTNDPGGTIVGNLDIILQGAGGTVQP